MTMSDNNNQPSKRQTTQQKRAAMAYGQVENVKKLAEKVPKEYKSHVRGFGAMVQIDGLGAALAFLKAKAGGKPDNAYAMLYAHLGAWMDDQKHTSGDLLASVIALDSTRYRHAATEILAYVVWLKRFAEALIEEEAKDSR
jgi:CRISPR-associated protein Cmr5